MSAILRLSATVPRPVLLRWYQAGRTARINCTGFTMETLDTTLPFEPAFEPVDLAQGEFRMVPPTVGQLDLLHRGRSYGLTAVLRNAAGDPVEDMALTIEAV